MKKLNISEHIVPVAEFKTGISKHLKSLNDTGHPLVITQNGRPAGVLITPTEYDSLITKTIFTESINRGLKNIDSGKSFTTEELKSLIESKREKNKTE